MKHVGLGLCSIVSLFLVGCPEPEPEGGCGDGVVEGQEECDDGNTNTDDGCSDVCIIEFCGDGITHVGLSEACDGGDQNSDSEPDACRTNCSLAGCGDGVTDGGEDCDDGNSVDEDGCSALCVDEFCGDGVAQSGLNEECDAGGANSDVDPDTCRTSCLLPWCGDGVVDSAEACDDGNQTDGDGCNASCAFEFCGDGVIQSGAGEICDDGNIFNDDGCTTGCQPSCIDDIYKDNEGSFPPYDINPILIQPIDGVLCPADFSPESGDVRDEFGFTIPANHVVEVVFYDVPGAPCATEPLYAMFAWGLRSSFEAFTSADASDGFDCPHLINPMSYPIDVDFTLMIWSLDPTREAKYSYQVFFHSVACGDGNQTINEGCDDGNLVDGDGCSASCYLECIDDIYEGPTPTDLDTMAWPISINGIFCPDVQSFGIPLASSDDFSLQLQADEYLFATLYPEVGTTCSGRDVALRVTGPGGAILSHTFEFPNSCPSFTVGAGAATYTIKAIAGPLTTIETYRLEVSRGVSTCGDGTLEGLEECDDGGTAPGDGCGPTCLVEGCGDGFLQAGLGEACDDGNRDNDDGCTDGCALETCGDGIVQAFGNGEECDGGLNPTLLGCTPSCQWTCAADAFEPNDTQQTAAAIGFGPTSGLSLCSADEDWYAIDVTNVAITQSLSIWTTDGPYDVCDQFTQQFLQVATEMTLFDPSSQSVALSNGLPSPSGNCAGIVYQPVMSGTYTLHVVPGPNAFANGSTYGLMVEAHAFP